MKRNRSIGHIKKIGENKYMLRLSLGFDDFGKRIQPSRTVRCSSYREAERLLLEFYAERDSFKNKGIVFVPKTLNELYDEWYKHHVKADLRAVTAEWYTRLWNTYVSEFGGIKLNKIAPAHIHHIIDEIKSLRTKSAVYKMLSAMFNKAVKWDYMTENPCNKVDAPKYQPEEKNVLTEDEIKRAVTVLADEELKYQAIFYFATICGMRRGEIIGLKWSDIEFKENTVSIRRAATYISEIGTYTDETKTKSSERTLFLPEILKAILLRLNNEQGNARRLWGDKWKNENWVFTQADGGIMNLHTPTQWWRKFAKKIGIENVTFHCLRHTAATYMIKNNVPISTVSGVLGHAQISTTLNVYTHVIEESKKTAINVMADIVGQEQSENGKKNESKAI